MLRPIPVKHYISAMNSWGYDENDVLVGTTIDRGSLADPGYLVSLEEYRRVFENMARFGNDCGLGLDIGLGFNMAHLGPLGYASFACNTPRQSMEQFWVRHGEMFGILGRPVFLCDSAGNTIFEIVTPGLAESAHRFCVEEALGLMNKIGRMVAGQRPEFERVEFAFAPPSYRERYVDLFRCPVHFEAGHTRVSINRRWLEKPLPTMDERLNNFYLHHLEGFRHQIEKDMPVALRIRNLFLHLAPGDAPSLTDVASSLGLSERTLCRTLNRSGLSYRKLVEDFRVEQAVTLIESNRAPAKEIAYQLGFRDVNAFRRAFKKWTGQTVRQYRAIDP